MSSGPVGEGRVALGVDELFEIRRLVQPGICRVKGLLECGSRLERLEIVALSGELLAQDRASDFNSGLAAGCERLGSAQPGVRRTSRADRDQLAVLVDLGECDAEVVEPAEGFEADDAGLRRPHQPPTRDASTSSTASPANAVNASTAG